MDQVHAELLQAKTDISALVAENASLRAKLQTSQLMTDMLQEQMLMTDSTPRRKGTGQQPLMASQFKGGDIVIGNGSRLTRAVVLSLGALPLVVQTPPMMVPFGTYDTKSRLCVRLAFRLEERSGRAFQKQLAVLERRVSDHFTAGEKLRFVPGIGIKDGTLRAGVSVGDCRAYDEKQQVMDVRKCLSMGNVVIAILKCNGIWFEEQRFGLSWSVLQVKLQSTGMTGLEGYAFQDD